ncbi:MAG: ABC transporter ATP-binding protein/permease [Coriobacteriales bacterium]|jgi:ATP-binding cassette subfamily B protein|nr:ABC transporter ATP-binding protein/permease [Coriobacteriales bacterium]
MLRRFIRYYRPYKGLFFLDFSCAVISAALELFFPLTVSRIVDDLLPQGNWSLILSACAFLAGVYVVSTGLKFVVNYWGERLGMYIETDLRLELYDHLQKLSFSFFDNNKTGKLASRISNDLLDVSNMAHYGPEHLFIALCTLTGSFALMLHTNLLLALVMSAVVAFLIACNMYFFRRLIHSHKEMLSAIAGFVSRLEDGIGGIRVVQSFTNEEHYRNLFFADNQRFCAAKADSIKNLATNEAITYLLRSILPLTALLVGSWFTLANSMTGGDLFSFILLANIMVMPIQMLASFSVRFPKGMAGFRNFATLMDTRPEIQDAPDAKDRCFPNGEIRYEDVSFSYESNRPILRRISLCMPAGKTTAIVGMSGVGKTTLCSLIPRFYEPDCGRITIDGTDIRTLKLRSLRKQIGVVQQDVFLFSGTIGENIRFGRLDATEEEVAEAVRRAQLDTLISELPAGLDTPIGERGVKLSGGQKQRVSIARMFLKNPPILILDEATSSLDTQTEAGIQRALAELSQGRTTLIIAHRLATMRSADHIIVLDKDGIAEQGTHDELLRNRGTYAMLYQAQTAR